VRALRDFTGWSQQELADQLSMRQQTISEWETGKYTPRRSTGVLLEFIAERVGFPYLGDAGEDLRNRTVS
jgi:transcriptional regulator with XRE-family HTH domain